MLYFVCTIFILLIRENVSLLPYNTFGIDAPAAFFTEVTDVAMLAELGGLPYQKYVLGGGSNVLLTGPVEGLVLQNKLKGMELIKEDAEHVWLKVASGEVWHELVMYAIEQGWAGIENLALIPGTAGASPMQNIGAYGIEAKSVIESVTFWHWEERKFITSVVYKLNKRPSFNTSYGAIEQELAQMGVKEISVQAIAQAVINIRTSKLPDPKQIGNAGSFFKNPTIPISQYQQLLTQYPDMPSYPVDDARVKVPAGWLIEQCGWKGYRKGDIGVHAGQALVLVNYGHAAGNELWALSGEVVASVQQKFGIELDREVQMW